MTLADAYSWVKGLHVAAAILFIGGLIAETAFLAAHRQADTLTPEQRRAVAAFRDWDRLLTTPAMLLVWAFGLAMASWAGWFHAGWLQAKLAVVLALSALHGIQSGALRRLAGRGPAPRAAVPILAIVIGTVAIALLAVAKPF